MPFKSAASKAFSLLLALQIAVISQVSFAAQAEMISTQSAVESYAASTNRDALMAELQREEIRAELKALGMDPSEAQARLAALSDEEVAAVLLKFESDPAGAGAVGSVVGALVTVFIILLVTDLLCLTKVFKFTRCQIN